MAPSLENAAIGDSGLALNKPLLQSEYDQYDAESCCVIVNEGEEKKSQVGGGTSFLRTCFNGVNALSGILLIYTICKPFVHHCSYVILPK